MRDGRVQAKVFVSVVEMARLCGLSRARFYQLVQAGTFPPPAYDVRTRRPVYPEELQQDCLGVRRRNCGVNGRPVPFYAKGPRTDTRSSRPRTPKAKPPTRKHADLIDGLAALGLRDTSGGQVDAALTAAYPLGVGETDRGEVLRVIFLHLERQNPADNAGR